MLRGLRPHLAQGPRGAHVPWEPPKKGAVNPLLQRFLISWAAGAAATGVVVGTAKRPHKLKRRKKRKKGQAAEPVQIGAVALKDARAPEDPGLSVEEWTAGIKALPARVAGVFTRVPKGGEGAREPDEVRTADGQKVATSPRGKKRRRRGKRAEATLWDSAKESMRQTVRDVVKEEVKGTPVGGAVDAARKASEKVKEGAAVVKEGAGVVAENAVKVGAQVGDRAKSLLNRILHAVEADPGPNAEPEAEALAAREAAPTRADEPVDAAAPSLAGAASSSDVPFAAAMASVPPSAPIVMEPGAAADPPADTAPGIEPGLDVAEVGKKLKGGLDAVGSWLQGPGSPGYTSSRARPAQGNGDVVEAKDAPRAAAEGPPPASSASPTVAPQASSEAAQHQEGQAEHKSGDAKDGEHSEPRGDGAGHQLS